MFYGEYFHSLDRKGRVILPAKFREVAKAHFIEKFFLTTGLDKCLFMFSEEEWRIYEAKFKSLPFMSKEARAFNRIYFSHAAEVIPDRQGRILLPAYLKDSAEIKKDVVWVGVSNRIEIWARDIWQEFYNNSRQSFEETAEKILSSDITNASK